MASLSHALSLELLTFFSVSITPKDFAKAHTTLFFLEGLFGKAFVTRSTAFPNICRLIFAGDVSRSSLQIFLASRQQQVASQ